MMKIAKIFAALAALATLAGCAGNEIKNLVTFHVATSETMPTSFAREPLLMPTSGFTLVCNKEPFMYNNDLTRADVAKVNLPEGGSLDGLYFTANERGTKRLFTATAANLNNFIVAKINGEPFALRRIDMAIADGKIFMVFDAPNGAKIDKTAEDLNESIEIAHKIND